MNLNVPTNYLDSHITTLEKKSEENSEFKESME